MTDTTSQSLGRSTNSSSSTSTPSLLQSPQSNFSLQLSQLLSSIGQGQYNWAQGQFNNASSVTDQQINNYLNNANQSLAQSDSLWNQYNNTFAPVMGQYAQEAQSWASPQMQNFNAGQAESTATQAADQAANNAKEQLMSFGVNPSSGMYGELEDAQQAARAASAASAGTEASLQTKQTGQQMLLNAGQMGQQLPGQSVNAMNAAYQGVAGAENSILGLENTGANLMGSANPYFSSAGNSLKMPGVGNTSQSQSFGTSTNQSQSNSQSGGGNVNAPSQANPWVTGPGDNSNDGFSAAATNLGSGAGSYADGGVIPTTGGHVPPSASPSHGAQTDDIPARLNADEYVIPRDVVHWKGKEFFEKLIQQSRKARGAPQQPIGAQMKPPLAGHPTFRSRPMTAGVI